MKTIGSYELKTHLARFLSRVMQGEMIEVTRRGRLIARIIPAGKQNRYSKAEAVKRLRTLQKTSLKGLTIRDLIEEGRRY
jgi:prevent-host-death family protein